MDVIDVTDVYSQYFPGKCRYQDVDNHALIVKLSANKRMDGTLFYSVSVSFFLYNDPEEFAVSGLAYRQETVLEAGKRRNRRKEKELLDAVPEKADQLARQLDPEAEIFWDRPLRPARMG